MTDDPRRKADAVEEEIEAVKNADSLADTPFSALFHEARTSTPNNYRTNGFSSVTVQVRVRDGAVETHDNPVKTRQGEHLRGTDAWDGTVSISVEPFMETSVARQEIVRQLRDLQRTFIARAERDAELERCH